MKFKRIKRIKKVDNEPLVYLSVRNNQNFIANNFCLHNCGYRGEISFRFLKTKEEKVHGMYKTETIVSDEPEIYEVGERIGQIMIIPRPELNLVEVNELSDSDRGEGGYGSTGA